MSAVWVPGLPGPQGSKNIFRTKAGITIVSESSKKVKPWRAAVVHAVREHGWPDEPFVGPVSVIADFYLPRPQRHFTAKHLLRDGAPAWCNLRPDVDKLLRATLDGLSDAKVWQDDSQVVALTGTKRYADLVNPSPTGAWISITGVLEEW